MCVCVYACKGVYTPKASAGQGACVYDELCVKASVCPQFPLFPYASPVPSHFRVSRPWPEVRRLNVAFSDVVPWFLPRVPLQKIAVIYVRSLFPSPRFPCYVATLSLQCPLNLSLQAACRYEDESLFVRVNLLRRCFWDLARR